MATKHELEIQITAQGKVEVIVKGAKGKRCMDYVQVFNSIGKVENQQPTSEYYEPEPAVRVVDQAKNRTSF